jgi:hypothetical protein
VACSKGKGERAEKLKVAASRNAKIDMDRMLKQHRRRETVGAPLALVGWKQAESENDFFNDGDRNRKRKRAQEKQREADSRSFMASMIKKRDTMTQELKVAEEDMMKKMRERWERREARIALEEEEDDDDEGWIQLVSRRGRPIPNFSDSVAREAVKERVEDVSEHKLKRKARIVLSSDEEEDEEKRKPYQKRKFEDDEDEAGGRAK